MKKEVSNFVALVVALIQGDDAQVKAIKIQKKAKAALTSQIAVKEAHTLTLEDAVDAAEETMAKVRVNGGDAIISMDTYISRLLEANRFLSSQKESLTAHEEVIAFLKSELEIVKA
tara:strand:- start:1227 stop:1574 length:348 start_codon:yes stop_codon:yes gene_type:complete